MQRFCKTYLSLRTVSTAFFWVPVRISPHIFLLTDGSPFLSSTAPPLSHLLGKRCPGVIVLTANLRQSKRSPSHPPATRMRTHLQVELKGPFLFGIYDVYKTQHLIIFSVFSSGQVLVYQRVSIHLSWQLFLRTSVERCCKISWESDHLPDPLLPPACLLLLHLFWGDPVLQRSALSSWQPCHLPSRRR